MATLGETRFALRKGRPEPEQDEEVPTELKWPSSTAAREEWERRIRADWVGSGHLPVGPACTQRGGFNLERCVLLVGHNGPHTNGQVSWPSRLRNT